MNRSTQLAIAIIVAALTISVHAQAEPMAADGQHDIGALLERARGRFGLDSYDAVILLDAEHVTFLSDGTRETRFHRIVWIATEIGIGTYADLRIPYDTATSRLEVRALRTWRDGQWWPHPSRISPTAVVETTPGALIRADDYTSIRETMLLHDGVELPCIVETAYTITETRPDRPGAYALWLAPRIDPAVRVELSVSVPEGAPFHHRSGNGAPAPEASRRAGGSDAYGWTFDLVDRLPRPLTGDPAAYVPHVEWSTWESREALLAAIGTSFDGAAVLNDALRDSVAGLIEHEPNTAARAQAVVGFVRETTRHVSYDARFWDLGPRQAVRTWETAYGHRLDRAVLAAALLREAGCDVRPAFVTEGYGRNERGRIPSLGRWQGVGLWVSGDGLAGYYDPSSGRLELGTADLIGRDVMLVGGPTAADGGIVPSEDRSALDVRLTLEPSEDGGWSGTGYVRGEGVFSPYGAVVGLGNELERYLGGLLGSLLDGAEIVDCNVATLTRPVVVAGFSFSLAEPEPDEQGRIEVAVGSPEGGVLAAMPANTHLYSAARRSPVLLPGPMTQSVRLRLKASDREVVHVPSPLGIENAAGRFAVSAEVGDDGWVTVSREIEVRARSAGGGDAPGAADGPFEARPWPALRALLLEEADRRGGTVLLR